MSEEKQKEALTLFCNAIEGAAHALRLSLNAPTAKPVDPAKTAPQTSQTIPAPTAQDTASPTAKPRFDHTKIQWQPRKGEKGEFELSEDFENPDHKALLAYLTGHPGQCAHSAGWFYWVFPCCQTIGRKHRNTVNGAAANFGMSGVFHDANGTNGDKTA